MKIEQVLSYRNRGGQNYAIPIIHEWEDELSKGLNIPIASYSPLYKGINRFHLHSSFIGPLKNSFRFVTNGHDFDEPMNNRHIIPCIIDFFEEGEDLEGFYRKHSNNKIILVSSPFDYQYLKDHNCPINIGLLAYSLPDKYALKKIPEKRYDIVLTGRQDPLLYSFFQQYIKTHPSVSYVKRGKDIENDKGKSLSYYLNGKEIIGELSSREDYISLLSKAKVSLYGTQGLQSFHSGFYHLTPAFLERIACGCHVIAHYKENTPDADYYQLKDFSPSIESYEEFEKAMDKALATPVDYDKYSNYLKKHYTSARVADIQKLLENL